MMSLDDCREILGDQATDLTDEEIAEIRDHFYWLADVCIDMASEELQLAHGKTAEEVPLRLI